MEGIHTGSICLHFSHRVQCDAVQDNLVSITAETRSPFIQLLHPHGHITSSLPHATRRSSPLSMPHAILLFRFPVTSTDERGSRDCSINKDFEYPCLTSLRTMNIFIIEILLPDKFYQLSTSLLRQNYNTSKCHRSRCSSVTHPPVYDC